MVAPTRGALAALALAAALVVAVLSGGATAASYRSAELTGREAEAVPLTKETIEFRSTRTSVRHAETRGATALNGYGEPTAVPARPDQVTVRLCGVEVSKRASQRVVTGTFEKGVALSMGVAACWPQAWSRTYDVKGGSYIKGNQLRYRNPRRYSYLASHYCEPLKMFEDDGHMPPSSLLGETGDSRVSRTVGVKDCKSYLPGARTWELPKHGLGADDVACAASFSGGERPAAATRVRSHEPAAGDPFGPASRNDLIKVELRDVHFLSTELIGEARVPTADTGGRCVWAELRHYSAGRVPFSDLRDGRTETPFEVAGRVSVAVENKADRHRVPAPEGGSDAALSTLTGAALADLKVALFDLMAFRGYSVDSRTGRLSAETASHLAQVEGLDAGSALALFLERARRAGHSVRLNPLAEKAMHALRRAAEAHPAGGHLPWLDRRALAEWDHMFPPHPELASYVYPDGWLMSPSAARGAARALDAVRADAARIKADAERFDRVNRDREAAGQEPRTRRYKTDLSADTRVKLGAMARARSGLHADNPFYAALGKAMRETEAQWSVLLVNAPALFAGDPKPVPLGLPVPEGPTGAARVFLNLIWRQAARARHNVGLPAWFKRPDDTSGALAAADGRYDRVVMWRSELDTLKHANSRSYLDDRKGALKERLRAVDRNTESLLRKAAEWFGRRLPSTRLAGGDELRQAALEWGRAVTSLPGLIRKELDTAVKWGRQGGEPDWARVKAALGSVAAPSPRGPVVPATEVYKELDRSPHQVDRFCALAVRLLHAVSAPPPLYGVLPTTTAPSPPARA